MESTPSLKTRSYVSCSRSGSSSRSAAAALARAKAEAAKAHLRFADEEERIKVEKAKLEAKMDKMVLERETAAAVAEAEALEAAIDTSVHSKHEPQLEATPADVMQQKSPAPRAQEAINLPQHGGEEASTPPTEVEAHCTEVCKDIEYRMRVHVFGNSPSPAVAIYCLRQSVKDGDSDVKNFVNREFYVDDGLTSLPTAKAAVDLLKNTQSTLAGSN
ncbi:hypothetical protein ROHU_014394 [Labeo rohita]|uniref:Uncharacterized protein n=1 Tax=Labeo rohita TaxID=84645 RepID=A0A498NT17_LABRO|nr:hypothetical protein ROHU_014394 [Labeo rohita]